jgi:hypothetical protein
MERHQERELAIGETERTQRLIEAASHGSRRALHMKAQAAVANPERRFERKRGGS